MIKLTLPVKKYAVTQFFGNSDEKYKQIGIVSGKHNGVDFRAEHGTEVYASHDGEAYYEIDDKGGHGVVIISPEIELKGSKCHFKSIYWHLCDPSKEPQFKSPIFDYRASKPKKVKQGELIGYADNTGFSTGNHVHFGLKMIDLKYRTLNYDNGYFGAIDPMPYFIDLPFQFYREMGVGAVGEDVRNLQKLLNKLSFLVAADGPGSPGNETDFYGTKTQDAMKRFQKSWGIWPHSGYFGVRSREVINKMQTYNPVI